MEQIVVRADVTHDTLEAIVEAIVAMLGMLPTESAVWIEDADVEAWNA